MAINQTWNTHNWHEKLKETPSMIKEMSDSDLEEIIALCHRSKQKAEALAFSAIPPQDHRRISTWYESDFVEGVVFAELNGRQAAVFRPILESQIEAFVGLEIQDYISLLMVGVNVLSAEDKVEHLKDLRKELMRHDDYVRYNSMSAEGLLPSQLDEIARSPKIRALWYSHSDSAIQLESFFSRIEFLSKTVIPGKVISGKIKAIGDILDVLQLTKEVAKNKGVEKNTTGKTKVPTQAQLAVFYRTMLQLDAYPVFTANGRTAESNYKEIGARHGLSPINFKKHFLDEGIRPFNTMGELINALTFEVVETLIQMLPEKEKAFDLLKIEKAKQ